MVVDTPEGFQILVDSGFKPYFHTRHRRWYLKKGRKHEIVAREIEHLAAGLYARLRQQRPPVRAGDVQEKRRRGSTIRGIVEDTKLSRGAVYEALEKPPDTRVKPRLPDPPEPPEPPAEEAAEGPRPEDLLVVASLLFGIPSAIIATWLISNAFMARESGLDALLKVL